MKRNFLFVLFLFVLLLIVCVIFSGCAQTIGEDDGNTQIEDENYGNSKNLFVLQNHIDNKYGYMDENGTLVIPYRYESAKDFREGLAAVQNEYGKYGYIDEDGNEVIPFIYDSAENFSEGLGMVSINNGTAGIKYGYVDEKGNEVIPFVYDEGEGYYFDEVKKGFRNGVAIVCKNEKYLIIDKKGNDLTEALYNRIRYVDDDIYAVYRFDKVGFINSKGEVISEFVQEGYDYLSKQELLIVRSNGSAWNWVIDKNGKTILPGKYPIVYERRNGDICAGNDFTKTIYTPEGNEIFTTVGYDIVEEFYDGLAAVREDSSEKWGYINEKGEEVIPLTYENAGNFSEGLAPVRDENYKCGYINKKGDIVIPLIYNRTVEFREGLAHVVDSNGKSGFINTSGDIIVPFIYDYADDMVNGCARVEQNDKFGFVDINGTEIIPCIYDDADFFSKDGFVEVELNDKKGLFDKNGNEIFPCVYEDINSFKRGLAKVELTNGTYGYINKEGKEFTSMNVY